MNDPGPAAGSGGPSPEPVRRATDAPDRTPDATGTDDEPLHASQRGSARDALAVPEFRRLYIGSTLSNAGRWLQTAALGVLGWKISESSAYLGAIIFAQLGPLGVLSLIGGSLADSMDRRRLLLITQIWQMAWTFVLAVMLIDGDIDRVALLIIVGVIGVGQGLYAPTLTTVIPAIAGERNLSAAIALNSMQINGTRVVGPAIGGFLVSRWGFAEVFALNGLSYVFVIGAIWATIIPPGTGTSRSFRERVFGGFTIARQAPQVGRPLGLMFLFAFFCLPFIGQIPAIAEVNLGVDSASSTYGWFYAFFGLGGLVGAALAGTVFLRRPATYVVPGALVGFAIALSWLAAASDIVWACAAIFCVGACYLTVPTALASQWQEHVNSDIRGRVAALWVLSFGGTVPVANVLAGQVIEATSLRAVLWFGAISALALTSIRLRGGPQVGEEILDR